MKHKCKITKGVLKGKTLVMDDTIPEGNLAGYYPKSDGTYDFYDQICAISYDILDEIVGKVCHIKGIIADCDIASMSDYIDSVNDLERIRKMIIKKYKLIDSKLVFMSASAPLNAWSLVVYSELKGKI